MQLPTRPELRARQPEPFKAVHAELRRNAADRAAGAIAELLEVMSLVAGLDEVGRGCLAGPVHRRGGDPAARATASPA